MAVEVGGKVKETLGAEVFEDLEAWTLRITNSRGVSRDEYRQILPRLDRLDAVTEGLKEEVYRLRGEFNSFRTEVNQRLDALNERMLSAMRWTVGTIALFGTMVTILLAVFKFVP